MKQDVGLYGIKAERINFYPFHLNQNLRLLYVLEGSLRLRFVSGEHILKTGDVEILNISEPVEIQKTEGENLVLIYEFNGAKAKQYCDMIDRGIFNCNSTLFYASVTAQKDQDVLKRKLRLFYEYYLDGTGEFLMEKAMEEIVVFVGDRCHDLKNMFRNVLDDDVRADRFMRIYTYILENCQKKINLKELAESEYLSPQYLSKEFNNRLKINFKDTLEYFRVIQSVRYLISSSMTVTQISELCGFSAPRYLYKKFGLYMNCTPMEFKKSLSRREAARELPVHHSRIRARMAFFETAGYGDRPSENWEDDLKEILEAAARVPSYGGKGRCFIVQAESAELKKKLAQCWPSPQGVEDGAALFIYCIEAEESGTLGNFGAMTAEVAVSVYQLCAAARQKGVKASVAAGPAELVHSNAGSAQSVEPDAGLARLSRLLKLPEGVMPVFVVAAGGREMEGQSPQRERWIPICRGAYNVE